LVLLAAFVIVSAWTAGAQAETRRTRAINRRISDAETPAVTAPANTNARPNPYAGRYPKFQGGFHYRQLQNVGVPTGDQGMRGNGFQMYPW